MATKEYYQKNRKTILEKMKKQSQRPEVKAKKREREQTPEYKEKKKEYGQKPEVKARRRKYVKIYNKNNAWKINNYYKQKRKTDPEYRIKQNLRALFNIVLRKYSKTGKHMVSERYGVDYEAIINYLKPLQKEFLKKYHTHHIIPLCTFNHDDPKQIKEAWAPENHKILTIEEHRKIDHPKLTKKINKFSGGSNWIKQFGYNI